MPKAIVLPYAAYQNEPSIPLSTLVDVPLDDEAALRELCEDTIK